MRIIEFLHMYLLAIVLLAAWLFAVTTETTGPFPAVRISAPGEQVFFGYYDVPAVDPATGRHLAHRAPFRDRLPTAEDEAELGWFAL